ncbi:Arylsulfatase G [Triplophysa tibetana]|uniref:Arylsulfatase G n=1 Tax=Triplophysa tibetana TaxID=1572043 RepID=A0A5A9PU48_9TELE|nr:Arylsulfatase G [Triplophysa tibetana]
MAQLGICALLLFYFLFSGLVHHIKSHTQKQHKPHKLDRPNFIIILADDIGWGDLWVKRPHNSTPTPWLDSLREKGKRHGLRNGVTHNFAVGSVGGLPIKEITLAQVLHDSGYYTAMIDTLIFTERKVLFNRKHEQCYSKVPLPLFENETIVEQPLDTWSLKERYAAAAVKQIKTSVSRKQPFLLYVALAHMHVPLFHNPFFNVTTQDPYTASLSDMDSLVGTIMEAVSTEQLENTLIWFTGGGSAKRTTWEGGHRVPTVVAWPKKIKPNSTSNALLSGMDIFPTILSLVGVKPPSDRHYDGIDITDILLNDSNSGHKSIMHPNSGAAGQFGDLQTVRLKHHKAFYVTGGSEACGGGSGQQHYHHPPLIFDLSRDEAEEAPLNPDSDEYRTVLREVEKESAALLLDIATDNVSTANYRKDPAAVPCCQNLICRCHSLK